MSFQLKLNEKGGKGPRRRDLRPSVYRRRRKMEDSRTDPLNTIYPLVFVFHQLKEECEVG